MKSRIKFLWNFVAAKILVLLFVIASLFHLVYLIPSYEFVLINYLGFVVSYSILISLHAYIVYNANQSYNKLNNIIDFEKYTQDNNVLRINYDTSEMKVYFADIVYLPRLINISAMGKLESFQYYYPVSSFNFILRFNDNFELRNSKSELNNFLTENNLNPLATEQSRFQLVDLNFSE